MRRAFRSTHAAALFLALGVAAPIAAQGLQLTPFVGGRFFGGITDYYGNSIDVDDAMSFGGFLTFMQTPAMGFELGYSRQDTDATLSQPFQGRERVDVSVDQWTLGVQRHFPRPNQALTPFGGGLVGLTHLSAPDESVTKFMLGVSGGGKFLRPRSLLGLRAEARGYFTLAGGGGAGIGCGIGGCSVGFSSQAFFQLDLVAGVILNFGRR